ncbi:MAG TPA: GNAT family N-acetyltransferase [bacterium]|nr:GNAT family N-acetyltransferase [bacterium]
MKITCSKPSEYEEMQRFLEEVYGHSRNSFSEGWPEVWKKNYTDFENILLIREKKRIVSLLRIFPLVFLQKGVKVKAAGIGSVSTLYSHRGKGYMSMLLSESFRIMKRNKYAVSVLWGDRHRYGYFGYENCGSRIEVRINARGLQKTGIKQVDAKRYFGDRRILGKISEAYNKNTCIKERTNWDFDTIYTMRGTATYYAETGGEFAYISVGSTESAGRGTVKEYGGSSRLILGMLKHLSERYGHSGFVLAFPDVREVPDLFLAASSGWDVKNTCMLKIIDIKETLQLFSRHPGFFFPEGKEITFTIKKGESATIAKKDGRLSIHGRKSGNEIVLSESEMARLLFGTTFWAPAGIDGETLRLLNMFLPFNLFVWHLDHI